MLHVTWIILLLSLISVSGCTWFSESLLPTKPLNEEALKDKDQFSQKRVLSKKRGIAKSKYVFELTWAMPPDTVSGYNIFYRADGTRLWQKIKVKESKLEKIDLPDRGYSYRYFLKGVSAKRFLEVRLQSYRGSKLSPLSEILKLPAVSESSPQNPLNLEKERELHFERSVENPL
jgi:hypothetical protein